MKFNETVLLDWDLPAGAVIGKKGRNVRWLCQQAGGAKMAVEDNRVVVRGWSRDVVNTAVTLLRAQINAHKRLVSPAYPHPLRVDHVLLEEVFGSDPRVYFHRCAGSAAALATGRAEPLFVLSPDAGGGGGSGRGRGSSGYSEADSLASLLAGISLAPATSGGSNTNMAAQPGRASGRGPSTPQSFHSAVEMSGKMSRALADAAHKAAANQPPFDILKIRLNLGTQYFYNLGDLEDRRGLKLEDIQGIEAPATQCMAKSVFSNHIPAATVPRVTSCLTDTLGFSLVDTKTSATLHVIDDALNVHYAVALTLEGEEASSSGGGGGGEVTLRKVKSSATKCHLVVLQGGPEQLDMRIKLLGERRDLQDDRATAVAAQIVRQCNKLGYDTATGHRRGGAASGLLPRDTSLDLARKKTKRVYEGGFRASSGRTLHLKLSVVAVEDHTGEHHMEITGTVPELDAALAQLRQQQAGGGAGSGRGTSGGGGGDSCGPGWAAEALQGLAELLCDINSGLTAPAAPAGP